MWFLLILVRLFNSNNKIYSFINQYITSKPNRFLSSIKDTQKSALAQLFYDRFRLFSTEEQHFIFSQRGHTDQWSRMCANSLFSVYMTGGQLSIFYH